MIFINRDKHMPSKSRKQQRFFYAVKGAKHDPNAPAHLRKVADSMSEKDIDDFTKGISELKIKKAILSVLKDVRDPMNLNEDDTGKGSINPVANTFHVKEDWSTYIKPYVGQPLSPKDLEALGNFKQQGGTPPTTTARTEVWYNTTDSMGISHTTVIKKMKDSGQFSFISFQKQERPTPDEDKAKEDDTGMNAGGPEDLGLGGPPEGPQGEAPPGSPTPPSPEQDAEKEKEAEKDDIIVTKSVLFKDDIKGAAILIEFLKKLDL
jgi:hypothetical protein